MRKKMSHWRNGSVRCEAWSSFALAFAAAVFFVACGHMGKTPPIECPGLSGRAEWELIETCGPDFVLCPSLHDYLSDVDAACRALGAS
jgi:hypothetical protein